MRKILTVKNLTYKSILKDIDFSFQENTFYLITGSNKCGKTTLIRILSGLIEVENTYFYQNQDVYHLSSSEFSKIFSSYFYNGSFSSLLTTAEWCSSIHSSLPIASRNTWAFCSVMLIKGDT